MTQLTSEQKTLLLKTARAAILHCLNGQNYRQPDGFSQQHPIFEEKGACFVTLTQEGTLRGCIGSLQARQSVISDVIENAVASATKDFRFPPLSISELNYTQIEISVLTPMELIPDTASEKSLLNQLNPHEDGLMISDGRRQATFLPQVWEQLPDKKEFLRHLKNKAGIPTKHWPDNMKCFRYQCIKFLEKKDGSTQENK